MTAEQARALRDRLGLPRHEVAAAAMVSESTVVRFERGERVAPTSARRIEAALALYRQSVA